MIWVINELLFLFITVLNGAVNEKQKESFHGKQLLDLLLDVTIKIH